MANPTPGNPLGQDPDFTDPFACMHEAVKLMVQQELGAILRGRTGKAFEGMADASLAMELIARGWVCYKPSEDLKRV